MCNISKNLEEIQQNIVKSAEKIGKNPNDIILLAVTKTVDILSIQQVFKLGISNFGENKVQEFLPKYEYFEQNKQNSPFSPFLPSWHFIGNLQTNKVKFIVDKVQLIHSVGSFRLAEEINKQSVKQKITTNILLEVNIAEEPTKHGVPPSELNGLVEQLSPLENICIKGLMCVAPYTTQPENNRKYFQKMNEFFLDISQKRVHNVNMGFLSMGMSDDYVIAIEEGANIVRVGTKLFGHRK
ncbi:MAG: YggS family pyridoxal phosphate-dependent enzyme [Firmicutes bacterium]|nr:YggS family pyridoxal phosphate-dependent enzyme [Bacillota bacterium]